MKPRLLLVLSFSAALAVAAGPAPGTRLDARNVAHYRNLLDDSVADLVAAGDVALTVSADEAFSVHPANAAAGATYAGQTRLDAAPGELEGYVSGRPFTQPPRVDDVRAGEKIAWNRRCASSGDGAVIAPFNWQ